jgi:hypothetical protein
MTALTNEQAFAELYYSKKVIHDVLGITVSCWRPPFGDVDDRIRYIAQALGMATVIWTDNTFDYTGNLTASAVVDANYQTIFSKQASGNYNTAGTIVLTHELNNYTMNENLKFLSTIQNDFKGGAMPIAVCMNNSQPYLEGSAFSYPNYAQWQAGTRSISIATASAVSSDLSLSIPFGPTQTGSVFALIAYPTPTTPGTPSTTSIAQSQSTGSLGGSGGTASSSGSSSSTTGSGPSKSGAGCVSLPSSLERVFSAMAFISWTLLVTL